MAVKPGYKQTEIGVIPQDWAVKSTSQFSSPVRGGSPRPAGDPRYFNGSYIPWLTVAALTNIPASQLVVSQTDTCLTEEGSLHSRMLTAGTLIIANSGATLGVAKILGIRCCANDGIAALLNLSKSVSPRFIAHFVNTKTTYLREIVATGNGQPNLNTELIGNFKIPFPPTRAEQDAIAEAFSDVDGLIESLEHLLAKKRHVKQGVMQELLAGKKRLPGFSGEWEIKPLGAVGSFLKGSGVTKDQTLSGNLACVRYGEIYTRHNDYIKSFYSWISREVAANAVRLCYGDILFAGSGETKEDIGKSVAFVNEVEAYAGGDIVILRTEKADPMFLGYYLNTAPIRRQKASRGQGDAVVHIGTGALAAIHCEFPSVPEQAAIAEILRDMDAEIDALENKLGKARNVKQGMIQELLTGEDSTNMSTIGQSERATQNRVIALFRDELGYRHLGDWSDRDDNSNIDEGLLTEYLKKSGYRQAQISVALHKLRTEADNHGRTLYGNNQAVYALLRYGVPVKIEAGKVTETVHLINWKQPEKNDFAVAEEVTLHGNQERRPDVVLYINGIAIGVLELKNSRVSIGDGIRQNLSNQQPEFNAWFFSTVQFIFAGNDSEGLQYGAIKTEEKYFLHWKEDEQDNSRFKLDKYLLKMCDKKRLIELMHDFVLFDGGVKKLPRVHQYFGIKAAQEHVRQKKGGIIWHTQGSGKSIVMVLLGKWILENNPNARVVIITDRDELDKQIERVFTEAGETIKRTNSGRDLMTQLAQAKPRMLCSLVHKFGRKDVDDFDQFIKDLEAQPSQTVGELFVFVDECHRTQSGKLNRVMKAMMPNAVFIGFTGTPLLKKDKATSFEVFGGYIHTYKFSEAVEDEVVLDLIYEARDINQRLGSQEKIDAWFDAKTKALNDWQKEELKGKWGTMQNVLSSKSRMDRVVADIVFDFSVKPRFSSERGNAILVASSIYEASKYFTLFNKTPFKGKCAVVTSYNPLAQDVTKEEVGANTETDKQFIFNTYTELLKDVEARPGMTKTETYEEWAKALFTKEPANMKLLVVVDKLLTGFDAPPCTYLYIDKSMQDHGLFQAICRTNRLDGDDKDFGYIVDYKDLFKKVENAIAVYTSELDHSAGGATPEVLLQDRLKKGKERLDNALEALALLCEPVEPPKGELEHIHYFCGNTEIATDLKDREPQRAALYKATVALVRAYANIADELEPAGYSEADIARIKQQQTHYLNVREIIRKASGESLDLKAYEADMRHLIDTYIEADEPRKISPFDSMGLLELIVNTGISNAINSQLGGLKGNKNAIAETIENNVRSKIIKEHLNDPAYYAKMSALLDEIIAARKAKAIQYEEYLKRVADLAKRVEAGQAEQTPETLDTPGKRALYNNLNHDASVALAIDAAVRRVRPDAWRGVQSREQVIKAELYNLLQDIAQVERIFLIIKAQKEY